MKTKWFGYVLLGVGIFLFLRSRSAAAGNQSSAGIPTDGTAGSGGGLSVGQIGSNFFESNSLADAVQGLVSGIWENGGEGYGGNLSVKTPDGTLNYYAPKIGSPLLVSRAHKFFYQP